MITQQVFDLLEKIHDEMPEYEEETIHLFNFLYNDIYRAKIIDVEKELSKKGDNWRTTDLYRDLKEQVPLFIDGQDSILTYYIEMINDDNKKFSDFFFKKISTYFKLVENNLYREDEFNPITLIFNFYMMFKAYHLYKDDLDFCMELVKDFSFLGKKNDLDDRTVLYDSLFAFLDKKKKILDELFTIADLRDYPVLKEEIKFFLDILSTGYRNYDKIRNYEKGLEIVKQVILDSEKIKESNSDFNLENVFKVISDILNDSREKEKDVDYEDEVKLEAGCFYTPILLYGERYSYIKECYNEYINNPNIMKEIINDISGLDNNIFKLLDEFNEDEKDSFITCMNIVFDSDTFYEVKSKLEVLKKASSMYTDTKAEIREILLELNELPSDKHKKVILDKKIMYDNSTMNTVTKPKRIVARTGKLIKNLFGIELVDYPHSMDDVFYTSETISDLEFWIDETFKDNYEEMLAIKKHELELVHYPDLSDSLYIQNEEETESVSSNDGVNTPGFQKLKSIFGKNKKGD